MASDKGRGPGSASAEIGKFLDILAKDPKSRVFAPLAEAYRKAGLLDDAVATALEGLKAHPNYVGGRVALGRAYFEKRQYAEAAAEMQKVIAAAPENIVAHKVLGRIAEIRGDLDAAVKSFKTVLMLDPLDKEARQFVDQPRATASPAAPPPRPAPAPRVSTPPVPQPVNVAPPVPPPAAVPATPREPEPLPAFEILPFDELEPSGEAAPAAEIPIEPAGDEAAAALPDFPFDVGSHRPAEPPVRPAPEPQQAPSGTTLDLNVLTRSRTERERLTLVAAPPVTPPPTVQEKGAPVAEPSPIETFGRPASGGPLHSTKGEEPAHREFEVESLSTAAEEVSAPAKPSGAEPEFEVFTREPAARAAAEPPRHGRGGLTSPRELDLETTAFIPPEQFVPEVEETQPLDLEDELPRIDLTRELDYEEAAPEPFQPEPEPAVVSAAEPVFAAATAIEKVEQPGPTEQIEQFAEVEQIEVVEQAWRIDELGDVADIGNIEDSGEIEGQEAEPAATRVLGEEGAPEPEVSAEEPVGKALPGERPSSREVFDTATLADIYVNQGFYQRAAEIYRRLIEQRPDDTQLKRKLDGVLALERGESGAVVETAVPVEMASSVEAAAPAAAGPVPAERPAQDERITRLQALLEAFKGGRPR